jgi:hypothetical protein
MASGPTCTRSTPAPGSRSVKRPLRKPLWESLDIEYPPLWAGESCGVVNDIKPAGEIVRDLVRDAEAALG